MSAQEIIKKTFAPAALAGKVYAREYGSTQIPLPVGNVLALELTHKEDVEKQPDMTQMGGGTYAELRRVSDMELNMTLADLNVLNLARACQGTFSGVDAGAVTDEPFKVTRGGLCPTLHLGPSKVTVKKKTGSPTNATVTDEEHLNVNKGALVTLAHPNATTVTVRIGASVATATTLTASGNYTVTPAGVQIDAAAPDVANGSTLYVSYTYQASGPQVPAAGNYEVRPAGIFILPTATGLADDDEILVDYEFADYAIIEALTAKPKELELIFEGLNEADSGKPVVVNIWRASQGVASSLALLQEKGFINMKVTGSIMQDPTKTGEGISKCYRWRKV
ncbi:hypothetical protein ABE501_05385 [Comamonas testosteroni]